MNIQVTVVVDQDGRQAVFTRSFDSLTDVSNALPGLDGEEWLVEERPQNLRSPELCTVTSPWKPIQGNLRATRDHCTKLTNHRGKHSWEK